MGWLRFDPNQDDWSCDHEGYVVAVEKDDWRWRELGQDDVPRGEVPVSWLQVSCECGWRSQRLVAPLGTTWSPCSVDFRTEADEDVARALWAREHRDQVTVDSRTALLHSRPAGVR